MGFYLPRVQAANKMVARIVLLMLLTVCMDSTWVLEQPRGQWNHVLCDWQIYGFVVLICVFVALPGLSCYDFAGPGSLMRRHPCYQWLLQRLSAVFDMQIQLQWWGAMTMKPLQLSSNNVTFLRELLAQKPSTLFERTFDDDVLRWNDPCCHFGILICLCL